MSPLTEGFLIINYSSKDVIINREFWEGPGSNLPDSKYGWHQTINDVTLSIRDTLSIIDHSAYLKQPYVLRPKRELEIITYYPMMLKYKEMEALPFMYKMKSIFKNLEIICNDGKTIITLENLGERIIKKREGMTEFILEIFDYDIVGKPASEW
jgi:hypothetical protein